MLENQGKPAVNLNIDLSEPKPSYPKYHPDGPFVDPLIRCNNCGDLAKTEKWKKRGHCLKCGNRRCRSIITLTVEEMEKAKKWGIDEDFLALFEARDDDDE